MPTSYKVLGISCRLCQDLSQGDVCKYIICMIQPTIIWNFVYSGEWIQILFLNLIMLHRIQNWICMVQCLIDYNF